MGYEYVAPIVLFVAALGMSSSCRRTETPIPVAVDAPGDAPSVGAAATASVTARQSASAAAPAASTVASSTGAVPAPSASTRPKDPRLSVPGPEPRDADAAREGIIEQVRPIVKACYEAARGKQTGQRGRLRVVMRFDKDMKVHSVDATTSGSVQRRVATCTQTRVAKTKFRTAKDTPRFLSFPVVLPLP